VPEAGIQNDLGRLGKFLEAHDLHLLADSTEAVFVGSIYKRDPEALDGKARRIGDVNNFIMPSIILPEPKRGKQSVISENFRDRQSVTFTARIISKFISSIGFAIDTGKEQILEVNYDKITYEEVDVAVFADNFAEHKLKTSSLIFKPDNEYYVVTKVIKSPKFRVNVKLSKNLGAVLDGQGGQAIVDGQFKMEYTKGRIGEVTMSYNGIAPLVFAVHLENIVFDQNNGNIMDLIPLSQVIKVLGPENRVWE
jgi:hypothetical protein